MDGCGSSRLSRIGEQFAARKTEAVLDRGIRGVPSHHGGDDLAGGVGPTGPQRTSTPDLYQLEQPARGSVHLGDHPMTLNFAKATAAALVVSFAAGLAVPAVAQRFTGQD